MLLFNHNILLDYNIEPKLNKYKTWIGKAEEEELIDILNIVKQNNYDEIIIDHYGIDYNIELNLKQYINKLTVISDIFDYEHYCDEYINYNTDDFNLVKKIIS